MNPRNTIENFFLAKVKVNEFAELIDLYFSNLS